MLPCCPLSELQAAGARLRICMLPLLLVPVVCAGRFARREHVRAVRSFGCVATQLRLQTARSCSGSSLAFIAPRGFMPPPDFLDLAGAGWLRKKTATPTTPSSTVAAMTQVLSMPRPTLAAPAWTPTRADREDLVRWGTRTTFGTIFATYQHRGLL